MMERVALPSASNASVIARGYVKAEHSISDEPSPRGVLSGCMAVPGYSSRFFNNIGVMIDPSLRYVVQRARRGVVEDWRNTFEKRCL